MRLARLIFGLLLTGLLASAAVAAKPEPRPGLIAFSRCGPDGCGNGMDIWVIREDGSGLRRVTREGTRNDFPSWSPDGRRLAFARSDGLFNTIWTMNLDGSHSRKLTGIQALDAQPAWSPDGTRIAFVRELSGGRRQIDVIDAFGNLRRVTHRSGDYRRPTWSPDGRRLAFAYSPDPKQKRYGIYVVDADGTRERQVSRDRTHDYWDPAWSPDGRRIAFSLLVRRHDTFSADLEVMDTHGGNQRLILRAPANSVYFSPSWSPTGRRIAFVALSAQTKEGRLAFVNADGTDFKVLKQILSDNRAPAWQPLPRR